MKVLKKAVQKNVVVNMDFLNMEQQDNLLRRKFMTFISDFDLSVHLYLDYVCELKVVYNKEFDMYVTVAVIDDSYVTTGLEKEYVVTL